MPIIELCGLPGSGKSTLVSSYIRAFRNQSIGTRSDIYNTSKLIMYCNISLGSILYRHNIRNYPNDLFRDFCKDYPMANPVSCVRIIDLHHRITKNYKSNQILLLDEGPLQYFSSLAYPFSLNNLSLAENYLALYGNDHYFIDCSATIDICIQRIRTRVKGGWSDISDTSTLELALVNKQRIISQLLSLVPQQKQRHIDMLLPCDQNVSILHSFISEFCHYHIPASTG